MVASEEKPRWTHEIQSLPYFKSRQTRRGFLCVHLAFTLEVLGRFAAKWRLLTIFLGGKFTVLVNSLFTINLEEQD
jgi:hypothetical protein